MEQRRHYRIPARELEGLTVSVSWGEHVTRGVLVDVSASGAGVRLSEAMSTELALQDHVVLRIGTHELPRPFEIGATTRFRQQEDDGTRYGFQFDDPDEFGRQLPPSLRAMFNRRYMVRVRPDPEVPVEVTVWTMLGAYEYPQVKVRDLSGIGMSLLVNHATARRLEGMSRIRLTVQLPGQTVAVDLFARIRYRLALGPSTRLGIEFDPRTTEDFAEKQHAMITYVVRRQQETAETPPN